MERAHTLVADTEIDSAHGNFASQGQSRVLLPSSLPPLAPLTPLRPHSSSPSLSPFFIPYNSVNRHLLQMKMLTCTSFPL